MRTHGKSRTAEYRVWTHMIGRCYNETDDAYCRYGARGIAVCQRWREDFNAFLVDMGKRPTEAHSIERLDNSKDYSPENCTWATSKQQARNRRSNRIVEYQGVTMHVTDFEEKLGLCRGSIYQKVKKRGISYQAAANSYSPVKFAHCSCCYSPDICQGGGKCLFGLNAISAMTGLGGSPGGTA